KCTNIEDMENYLARTGVPLTKLDELSVIHVAGTKGKHGLRTGFYSSPHLVAARERVRLGGRPLSELAFATHFHRVYEMLHDTQEYEGDMPKYFAFLTVMAYNVFLTEKVDVAVIEIAAAKAGVMKPGCAAYTVRQPADAMQVLRQTADAVKVAWESPSGRYSRLRTGPLIHPRPYTTRDSCSKGGCHEARVRQPADAMQVLRQTADAVKVAWESASGRYNRPRTGPNLHPRPYITGDSCSEGGCHEARCSLTIAPDYNTYTFPESQKPNLQVNLEAYRTNASLAIQLAHSWLRTTQGSLKKNGFKNDVAYGHNGLKNGVNLGQIQYEVPSETMEGLKLCIWPGRYQHVYCVIPTAHRATTDNNDNYSIVEQQELIQRCRNNAHAWGSLSRSNVTVLECVSDALVMVKEYYLKEKPSVLITGSLHLVGAA
ncbi:Folylpolyglutamate synthase, mitochondrial, partial [Operophtera brumata]